MVTYKEKESEKVYMHMYTLIAQLVKNYLMQVTSAQFLSQEDPLGKG